MQRFRQSRGPWATAIILGGLLTFSCVGPKLKYDADRLHRKCGLTGQAEVKLDQARCMAKIAGLKESRKCPFELKEVVHAGEGAVIQVRETCSTLGMDIAKATGEVVGVEFGDSAAP